MSDKKQPTPSRKYPRTPVSNSLVPDPSCRLVRTRSAHFASAQYERNTTTPKTPPMTSRIMFSQGDPILFKANVQV